PPPTPGPRRPSDKTPVPPPPATRLGDDSIPRPPADIGSSQAAPEEGTGSIRGPGGAPPEAPPPPAPLDAPPPNAPPAIPAFPPEDQPEQGPAKELPPQFRRELVDFVTKEAPGTIVI